VVGLISILNRGHFSGDTIRLFGLNKFHFLKAGGRRSHDSNDFLADSPRLLNGLCSAIVFLNFVLILVIQLLTL